MKISMTLFLFLFTTNTWAAESTWKLTSKIEGPQSFDCSQIIVLMEAENAVRIDREGNTSVNMDFSEKPQCKKANSSNIIGGVRCYASRKDQNGDILEYRLYDCSTSNPFRRECNPLKTEPSTVVQIQNSRLRLSIRTGWISDPVFTCEYSK
ncbi:MAG: hypothetical protein AB7O96_12655 [Pseudobdellovibrionaceae bacterium]